MKTRSATLRRIGICLLGLALSAFGNAEPTKASRILVDKSERTLKLIHEGRTFRSYPVALGDSPRGHKLFEGDERTPEGLYHIDGRNPNSAYHLALSISYPNRRDVARATERASEVLPTPGGPTKQRIEPWTRLTSRRTARNSRIRSLIFSSP